jgi:hypothetical protein
MMAKPNTPAGLSPDPPGANRLRRRALHVFTREPLRRAGDREAALEAAFPRAGADLLEAVILLLTTANAAMAGDMEKFMILLLVLVRTLQHPAVHATSQAQLMASQDPTLASLPINIASIAASLDIPKETVRRKVRELAEAGWLVRGVAQIHLTPSGYRELAPLRARIERMALRLHDVVHPLLPERRG